MIRFVPGPAGCENSFFPLSAPTHSRSAAPAGPEQEKSRCGIRKKSNSAPAADQIRGTDRISRQAVQNDIDRTDHVPCYFTYLEATTVFVALS